MGLRMITAIGVGDLMAPKTLVVISGDGWCQLLLLSENSSELSAEKRMYTAHIQRIPPNAHCMALGDIDGDGKCELVLGLTDRVVRSYRWKDDRLVSMHKWETASQVGSVCIGLEKFGIPSLLVSQPGGSFLKILCRRKENEEEETEIEYHPMTSTRMRNVNVSTEIIGSISVKDRNPDQGTPYALATMDGTLMLVQDQSVIWSIQLHRQLFALTRMDITDDGMDEIIVCSWDGQTYIIGQDQVTVKYQFEESVAAFIAGRYGPIKEGRTLASPCLVYVQFNDKIVIFTDINLSKLRSTNLDTYSIDIFNDKTKSEKENLVKSLFYGKTTDSD